MRKKESGITLIALVITIIVILILAGITIGSLTGDNSIIDKAGQAKNETELASAREKVEAEYIMCLERGELNVDKFKTNIRNSLGIEDKDIIDNGDGTWTIKFKGTDINTGEKEPEIPFGPGIIVAETENKEWSDKDGDKAVIPGGFGIVSGLDDVSEGLVITDNFENDGNEFVWIPVETAVAGSETQGTTTKAMAMNKGTEANPQYRGLLYEFIDECSTVISGCTTATINNREPDIVINWDTDARTYLRGIGLTQASFQAEMQEAYNDMIKSVSINHGFYISRYEMSLDANKKAQSKKLQPSATAGTSSANMWYGLYDKAKKYALKTDSEKGVVSSMVWGSQYDAMMNWMQKEGIKVSNTTPITGVAKNETRTTGGPNDGQTESKDILKNVYDLLGNSYEWTLEADNSSGRAFRGGSYSSSLSPAYRLDCSPDSSYVDYYSTRLALYIK